MEDERDDKLGRVLRVISEEFLKDGVILILVPEAAAGDEVKTILYTDIEADFAAELLSKAAAAMLSGTEGDVN